MLCLCCIGLAGILDVFVHDLSKRSHVSSLCFWGLNAILGLFFVVGNTIKLAIENRKAEILVIKLVGGSDLYAARPFLYTGLLYGLGGGILATVLQGIVLASFNSNLEVLMRLYQSDFQLRGFGLMSSLLVIVAGAAISWTAALMASLRHIRAIDP